MKYFKKTLSVILCFVIVMGMCTFLSSCHGGGKPQEEFRIDEEFNYDEDTEITFWAKNDSNNVQKAIYSKAAEDFQKLYPNVKVNIKFYTDYGKIYEDVITNIQTGTTPNVCISYPDHIATYMQGSNIVVSLDDLMRDVRYGLGGSELKFEGVTKEEIIPQFLEEGRIADKQYAIPFMRSTEACYINKTYVEKLGYTVPDVLTWDFIWEVSEAALAKNPDGTFALNSQKVMIPFIYKSTDNMMISMLKQCGGGYSTSDAQIEIFNDTTKELLYRIGDHAATRAFSTFKIDSYPGNKFNAGQCIFAIDSTAGASWIGPDAPLIDIPEEQLVDFETVVRPIPQYDTEKPQMISQGPSVCIFNKANTQEVIASWFFVQYLLTNEVQVEYSKTEGYVPVTRKAQESQEYKDYLSRRGEDNDTYYSVKIDAAKLLLDNTDKTFVTPVFSGSASLRDAAGQMIEEVVKARRRNKTVDDAFLNDLFEKMESLYKLDQVKPVK